MLRSPVITIMGHVDHGKTTLLDYLRQSRLAAREAGGITQHVGAYQVQVGDKKLTFIDTPGHAAFNKMRERGAQLTDIVVLVVAANDGVKPQTIESIRHIKNAQVPVVVAINKIDLPDVNVINVKSQLAEHDILVTDFGGDVEAVEISAKTGKNIDKLLETLVITADLLELKADPQAKLEAIILESTKDANKGPVANVIVKNGTLRLRQDIFAGEVSGRVRNIVSDQGKNLTQLLPGEPGQIVGLRDVAAVGAVVTAEKAEAEPEEVAAKEFAFDFSALEDKKKLKFILKADTQGTLEAIAQNFDEESIDLIGSGVGEVTDNDIDLAKATGAKILAFQVKVPNKVAQNAKDAQVKIKEYTIIYQLIEYIQKKMLKLIEPTIDEVVTGTAEIGQIFEMKGLRIAGVKVKTGEINKGDLLHLKRGEEIIASPVLASMMHEKQEVTKLTTKSEGGLTFRDKKLAFQVGDQLIAYTVDD
ncbi:MAG: translation initiation factor IF-2 [bacterium]|nr:translation initiation factor IF-2 [bacterium]